MKRILPSLFLALLLSSSVESTESCSPEHQLSAEQNFPNPFERTTTFPLTLENRALVGVEVFDMSGDKRAELAPLELPPGEQQLQADFSRFSLNAGNYVYRITIRSNEEGQNIPYHLTGVMSVGL